MHPIAHGSHNNMYLIHKRRTFNVLAVVNFDTENVFILNFKSKKILSNERKKEIYGILKSEVEEKFDFKLKSNFDETFIYRNKIEYNEYKEYCNGK